MQSEECLSEFARGRELQREPKAKAEASGKRQKEQGTRVAPRSHSVVDGAC